MGNHRIVIRTCGNTDSEVDHFASVAAAAIKGYNATVEKFHHYHGDQFRDLTKQVTGHDPVNTYDSFWESKPVDVSTSATAGHAYEEIAASAYRAYAASTGNKNFRGEPMPSFEDLPIAIKTAWEAATRHVLDGTITEESEQCWNGWTRPQDHADQETVVTLPFLRGNL